MGRASRLPNGLTLKEDAFARKFVNNGGNASKAYREAYSAKTQNEDTINRSAHTVLRKPKISARIQQLQEEKQEKVEITADYLTVQLLSTIERAKLNDKGNVEVAAMQLLAKIHGLVLDRLESKNVNHNIGEKAKTELNTLTDDQLVTLNTIFAQSSPQEVSVN